MRRGRCRGAYAFLNEAGPLQVEGSWEEEEEEEEEEAAEEEEAQVSIEAYYIAKET